MNSENICLNEATSCVWLNIDYEEKRYSAEENSSYLQRLFGKTDNYDFDVDAYAIMVGKNGKGNNDTDFVFYNNLCGRDDAVIHWGDCMGGPPGENFTIDFRKMPSDIERLLFICSVWDANNRHQSLGMVNSFIVKLTQINCIDGSYEMELGRYEFDEDYSGKISIELYEFYKERDQWIGKPKGIGTEEEIKKIIVDYGITV